MARIIWQAKNPVLVESFNRCELPASADGGTSYDYLAARLLSRHHDVSFDPVSIKRPSELLLSFMARVMVRHIAADVVIQQPPAITLAARPRRGAVVGMVHHLDFAISKGSWRYTMYHKRLIRRLRELDGVVSVSAFWRDQLMALGCRNVHVIYNSFDPRDFDISDDEVESFIKRHRIFRDRPLIYIGNAKREKGVYEVYESLKKQGHNLVMTGARNEASDLPVLFLSLDRREYLILLKACDVVLTMSTMMEGWNRTAHEALLLKRPVIGSGSGGMEELLSKAGQSIVHDFRELAETVALTLERSSELGETGYSFARQFDLEYFATQWDRVIGSYC